MDKGRLEEATKYYWDFSQNNVPDDYLQYYICERNNRLGGKSLLEAELEWAKEKECITAKPCKTLGLLVGFSLEPLLQSACVHKPTKIVLLLNEEGYLCEEWQDFARHLTTAIELLRINDFDGSKVQFLGEKIPSKPGYPTKGDPASIFRTLVEVLHNEEDVVIDITGGKKSMVTGAFMYAAYAGARISYVDFEEYDPQKRRPYGYCCKIGELSNPYEKFALHEWERVRTLYERNQFRDARLLLIGDDEKGGPGTIVAVMQEYLHDPKNDKRNRHLQNAIKLLAKILWCYEYWDAGLYNEAAENARDIPGFKPPHAVSCLDGKWIVINQARFEGGLSNFYEDTSEFQAYVYDELARIRRLIEFNCDYRSAFLRAGSLDETIMLARLVKMVEDEPKRKEMIKALQKDTPGAWSVFENLAKSEGNSFPILSEKKRGKIGFSKAPEITVKIKKEMDWWKNLRLFGGQDSSWEQFIKIRNNLTHKYYTPPRIWAEDAFKFVNANVEDFWGQQMSTMGLQTTAMSWSELVDLCGISCYLPPNLMKEI